MICVKKRNVKVCHIDLDKWNYRNSTKAIPVCVFIILKTLEYQTFAYNLYLLTITSMRVWLQVYLFIKHS